MVRVYTRLVPIEYLMSRIKKDDETGCWNWIGPLNTFGYGLYQCANFKDRTSMNASRVSWILHNGDIESRKIYVCHKCDNKKCCNPDHLFLGTAKDNMQDHKAKGKSFTGSKHALSILTEEQVIEARRLRQSGASWKFLIERFKVSGGCIVKAVTGQTWKHLDEPIPTYMDKPRKKKNESNRESS